MATPLLSLVIYATGNADLPTPMLGTHTVASGRLKLQPDLDARVSLLATSELAKASPSYAADLEATTHFMERLETATKGITDQLVMPDDLAALVVTPQLDAEAIAHAVMTKHEIPTHRQLIERKEMLSISALLIEAINLARR